MASQTNPAQLPVAVTGLTFDDEFNSFSASATGAGTTWQDLYPYGGEAAHDLSGNNEAEYYSSALPGQANSPFSDNNGTLTISAFPAPGGSDPYGLPYTSGVITTAQSFSQTYGYFEIDAKLPAGQGLWPAFWMLPTDGYTAELDDFEVVNNSSVVNSTVHGTTDGQWGSDFQSFNVNDLSQSFNVFGFNWTPTTVTFYLNGVEYGSAPTPQSMDSPMYMLLNLAVGGNGSWPGLPNSSTVFPANMQVDWVRAFSTSDTTSVGGAASITPGSAASVVTAAMQSTSGYGGTTTPTQPVSPPPATTPAAPIDPAPLTIGSGPDTLSLSLAEDAYQGDAQFTVSVDGVQQGGTYTETALQSLGEAQTVNIEGTFAAGAHTFTVDFLNDDYGGTSAADRNLYIDGALVNGAAVPNATIEEYNTGSQTFAFTAPGDATTPPAAGVSNPAPVTIGSGPDTLAVTVGEDAYKGDAQFTVAIDGVQQGGTYTTTAIQSQGESQVFNFDGTFAPGAHTVSIAFINDLCDWGPGEDRNLYVDSVSSNGTLSPGSTFEELINGPVNVGFAGPAQSTTPAGPTPDTLTIAMTEDQAKGIDAATSITLDGTTIGTPTVSFLNSAGTPEVFTFTGDFGGASAAHALSIALTNGITAAGASGPNLYIDNVTFDGVALPDKATLYSASTVNFAIPAQQSPLLPSGQN